MQSSLANAGSSPPPPLVDDKPPDDVELPLVPFAAPEPPLPEQPTEAEKKTPTATSPRTKAFCVCMAEQRSLQFYTVKEFALQCKIETQTILCVWRGRNCGWRRLDGEETKLDLRVPLLEGADSVAGIFFFQRGAAGSR